MNSRNHFALDNAKISNFKVDKVVLLDGRIIETKIGQLLKIVDRDGNLKSIRFDVLALGNALHERAVSRNKCNT